MNNFCPSAATIGSKKSCGAAVPSVNSGPPIHTERVNYRSIQDMFTVKAETTKTVRPTNASYVAIKQQLPMP